MKTIIDISNCTPLETETLGVKDKFWFTYKTDNDEKEYLYMFKRSRPNTGEHWAEVISSEIAKKLKLPCATYHLSKFKDELGIITKNLITEDQRLIHGNELIGKSSDDTNLENVKNYHQKDHKLSRVLSYFKKSSEDVIRHPSTENKTLSAIEVFVGYILFDVLISNQDRHNQNWGIIRENSGFSYLCPTYDHGSSLGRNETEARIVSILNAKNNETNIEKYVSKARSAFFPTSTKNEKNTEEKVRALLTIEALKYAGKKVPNALQYWKSNLAYIANDSLKETINSIPIEVMSENQKNFAYEILIANKKRILLD